jgi:hypothetical protein
MEALGRSVARKCQNEICAVGLGIGSWRVSAACLLTDDPGYGPALRNSEV